MTQSSKLGLHAWGLLLVGLLVGGLLALLVPSPQGPDGVVGDQPFAEKVSSAVAPLEGLSTVSAVRIDGVKATWAGLGDVTEDSRYELGSITKTFNGLLLADAVERGEVTLDDPLVQFFPELEGTPAADVTLAELASHRSGLPSLGELDVWELMAEDLAGRPLSVYADADVDDVIQAAKVSELENRGEMAYSNLGASMLGHALARATQSEDWPTLVEERLLAPLGMTDTHLGGDALPDDIQQPHEDGGREVAPWRGEGYAPAGVGVSTTAADITRYARAVLDGSAPGVEALTSQWSAFEGQQIGLAWIVADAVAWHNGGTGGSRTMLAVDREAGTAAIVLNNTNRDVTGAGFELLGTEAGELPEQPPFDLDTVGLVATGILAALLFGWGAVRARSRIRVLGQGLAAVGNLALWALAAPWYWSPLWLFGGMAGLTVAGIVIAVSRWRDLAWLPERRRPIAVMVGVLGMLWFVLNGWIFGWVIALKLGSA